MLKAEPADARRMLKAEPADESDGEPDSSDDMQVVAINWRQHASASREVKQEELQAAQPGSASMMNIVPRQRGLQVLAPAKDEGAKDEIVVEEQEEHEVFGVQTVQHMDDIPQFAAAWNRRERRRESHLKKGGTEETFKQLLSQECHKHANRKRVRDLCLLSGNEVPPEAELHESHQPRTQSRWKSTWTSKTWSSWNWKAAQTWEARWSSWQGSEWVQVPFLN